jgi:hypothetical protein
MKKARTSMERKSSAGSRIVASLREAVDWAEGSAHGGRAGGAAETGPEPGCICRQVRVPARDTPQLGTRPDETGRSGAGSAGRDRSTPRGRGGLSEAGELTAEFYIGHLLSIICEHVLFSKTPFV